VEPEGLIRREVAVDSHTKASIYSALAHRNEVGLPVLHPGRVVLPSVLVAVWVDQGYDVVVVVAVALRARHYHHLDHHQEHGHCVASVRLETSIQPVGFAVHERFPIPNVALHVGFQDGHDDRSTFMADVPGYQVDFERVFYFHLFKKPTNLTERWAGTGRKVFREIKG